MLPGTRIDEQCKIAEIFIKNPTNALYTEIDTNAKSSYNKFRLLSFFAWVAKNNRTDLLNTEGFGHLFVKYPKSALESLKIAVVFDAQDYVKKAITKIGGDAAQIAIMIACASGNYNMLVEIVTTFNIVFKSIPDDYLFWAMRSNNINVVSYLLDKGVNPNDKESVTEESYVMIAAGMRKAEMMKLCIQYGGNFEDKNDSGQTALHRAVTSQYWDIAFILAKDYGADIYAVDKKNKTPLDYIEENEIKSNLISLYQQHKMIQKNEVKLPLTLGFLSSTTNNKDLQQPATSTCMGQNYDMVPKGQ